MISKHFLFLAFPLFINFGACKNATPAGFWKSFRKEFFINDISDQRPYGGHRAVYWKSDSPNTFTSDVILNFAKRNGWTLIDSSQFGSTQTSNWTYDNKAVFPLTSNGFSDTSVNDARLTDFPRWFGGQVKVYKFKSGWVTIEPATDESIEENGFVMINNNGSEMSVYHVWGE